MIDDRYDNVLIEEVVMLSNCLLEAVVEIVRLLSWLAVQAVMLDNEQDVIEHDHNTENEFNGVKHYMTSKQFLEGDL